MNSYQAKKIPIQEVLAKLGHLPVRRDKGGVEWVYNSPFRRETIPSFFVNIEKNVWNDFGDIGGNVLDFIMRYENLGFREALSFLERLHAKTDFKAHTRAKPKFEGETSGKQDLLILDRVLPLKSPVLENYLRERSINVSIARHYLKVVQFHHGETGTKYFGLGIENLSGDYEVRNPKLKTVIGKKDISFIKGKGVVPEAIVVFEGFTDFLSYLTSKKSNQLESDVLILNSAKMTERAKAFISERDYQKIYTFFDNDKAGKEASEAFAELGKQIIACNYVYEGFKDFNEYWKQKGNKEIGR